MTHIHAQLLDACRAALDDAEMDQWGDSPLGLQLKAAISAADELQKPVDEDWLRGIATKQTDVDLEFGDHLVWSFSGRCFYSYGRILKITSRLQLVSLLHGLGVDVDVATISKDA